MTSLRQLKCLDLQKKLASAVVYLEGYQSFVAVKVGMAAFLEEVEPDTKECLGDAFEDIIAILHIMLVDFAMKNRSESLQNRLDLYI